MHVIWANEGIANLIGFSELGYRVIYKDQLSQRLDILQEMITAMNKSLI